MTTDINPTEQDTKNKEVTIQTNSSNAVYGLGLIGALVYYIGRATTIREGLQGFFKGLFWPAFLVHDLLKFLQEE